MENKKQTVVEWLANEINKQLGTNHLLEELFQQAIEMEKYQILDAYVQGSRFWPDVNQERPDGIEPEVIGAVDYYDNVYNK